MTPKWTDITPLGRAVIIVVVVLTLGIAGVSFLTSYDALYHWAQANMRYSDRIDRIWPLMFDAGFVIAQAASIYMGIVTGSRFWPYVMMALSAALTIWLNVLYAGVGWGPQIGGALPPLMMIIAFECILAIVKATMRALGRPLEPVPELGTDGDGRSSGRFGIFAGGRVPEIGQLGQGGGTKRQAIEGYLQTLTPEDVLDETLTARQLVQDLKEEGVEVSERYASPILQAAKQRASTTVRRNGKR